MKLSEHLNHIRLAGTPKTLEAAFQAAIDDRQAMPFTRTWAQIHRVMRERGLELCRQRVGGTLVPRLGQRRSLELGSKTYRVGYGGNSTGERYVWHDAGVWVDKELKARRVPKKARETIWAWALSYPHRALRAAQRVRYTSEKDA